MESVAPVRAVLFDLDGVLVETEGLKARAHVVTAEAFGGHLSEQVYLTHLGEPLRTVAQSVTEAAGLSVSAETYARAFTQTYAALLTSTDVVPAPGAFDLLALLDSHGWRRALVTSSARTLAHQVLESAGLPPFDAVVSAEDVTTEKPAPEPYLRALALTQITPASAVVLEDSSTGIRAAVAAGLRAVAIRHRFNADQDLAGASACLSSLADVPQVYGLLEALLRNDR